MTLTSDTKFLTFSIAGHIFVFLVLTVKILFFPAERPTFVRAVRVDIVGLPDKDPIEAPKAQEEKKEEPKAEEKPAEKPVEKKVEKVKPKPKEMTIPKKDKKKDTTKDEQENALDRLKALSKIKKIKEKTEEPTTTLYKGNIISKGSSLTGVEKLQHDEYLGTLDSHIKKFWSLPAFLENSDNLKAILNIKFDEKGNVISKTLIQSSGNHVFDQKVLEAIEEALPLPSPPESLADYLKYRGIELRFPE